jgi:hypothetical protein
MLILLEPSKPIEKEVYPVAFAFKENQLKATNTRQYIKYTYHVKSTIYFNN